jgi:hypothetical protein
VLPPAYEWMVEDKVVGITTWVLSALCIVVASLLTQRSHPPRPVPTRKIGGAP